MDKRTVVTAVLCSAVALGASAAMTKVVPAGDGKARGHAKAARTTTPSRPPSQPSSQSQAPERRQQSDGRNPGPSASPSAPGGAVAFAGALFAGDATGDHYCTATVVHSPGRNLIATAGHCLSAGRSGERGASFAPAYADGRAPYGTWRIAEVFEDPRWSDGTDDDYDLAFARLAPDAEGRAVEDVTGAAVLDTTGRTDEQVTVTGYPSGRQVPRTCVSRAVRLSATEQRFDCADFPTGTSGSAWIAADGKIIGVLTGGDTDDVSTSTILTDYASALYARATGPAGGGR
ncbi:trypsin-like serine peptidase [Streptomyces sp. NBC_01264]|uniref:trypsin-like serine peptidase n=1 Tax=Streptomyces sp. NBC_01264 TaxID=2903804 RepID=UPI0022542194|nr:trypsin-like peptidase domain-containing protein [Streptomyces sp. NBC_01264]MCX4779090.1 trypsin-like peptidase domain-containing protein [Streptomyces sp. NBC_01264]